MLIIPKYGPGKSGKSWNFIVPFSRTEKSWKKAAGHGILGVKGLVSRKI